MCSVALSPNANSGKLGHAAMHSDGVENAKSSLENSVKGIPRRVNRYRCSCNTEAHMKSVNPLK